MTKYIRKIDSIGRWDGAFNSLYDGSFCSGDILLSELKTVHNTLSIWGYETEEEKEEVLVAIALSRQHLDKLAFVMMDEKYIRKMGIPLIPENGIADGITRNDILQRHFNLEQIDFWRLGFVAEYITSLAHDAECHNQLSVKNVYQLIEKHVRKKNIDLNLVNKSLLESYTRVKEKYCKMQ